MARAGWWFALVTSWEKAVWTLIRIISDGKELSSSVPFAHRRRPHRLMVSSALTPPDRQAAAHSDPQRCEQRLMRHQRRLTRHLATGLTDYEH